MPRTRRIAARLLAALVGAAVLTGLAVSSPASGTSDAVVASGNLDDFVFESMDAEYTLGREDDDTSTLRVVETFVAVFPEDQNRGIRRDIPAEYNGQPTFPDLISVTDEAGDPRPSEVETDGDWMTVTSRADGFLSGRQTFVFTYTLRNVTDVFADTSDEFYWDVNGNGWRQPFGEVTATLVVPAELAGALTGAQACYVGGFGAETTCPIEVADSGEGAVVTAGAQDLAPTETLTIAVGFETGTFARFDDSYLASGWGWAQGAAGIAGLGMLGAAIVVNRRSLRGAPGRPTIIAEFTPPPGIDALESALLLGKTAKAIPAEVLEQAVVGSIRILEGEKRWFGGAKLQAELVDASRADRDGRMLLEGLFDDDLRPGEIYEFGGNDTHFSRTAQKILAAGRKELKSRGLYRTVPARVRAWPIVVSLLIGVLIVLFGVFALAGSVDPLLPILPIVLGSGLTVATIAIVSTQPLSATGAEVRDHLAGLKIFIEWAEADRIRMLQTPTGAERRPVDTGDPREMLHLYERLLPYAVVFGQEKEWAQHLAIYYGDDTPGWYVGTTGFNAAAFSVGISSLSATAASSSSSGGSSGGGSAGGGGGGGGGGGV
ncbi:DUF2207 domain-containing protein [Microbacterium sp. ET2]|uniref:DUF2207 domain-containing protein n=1 Tax=Microbacterium albipurpureum TaxID=3050384 RepID=UPI00259CE80F|nr:DUF2207 domain-containing protein [Microbacterium sp. ET2 (Ac-2212)]WJL96538.1 DUF2207 domain-containing protein [Microbacterium sp. ET2 (Ac-2212)]